MTSQDLKIRVLIPEVAQARVVAEGMATSSRWGAQVTVRGDV